MLIAFRIFFALISVGGIFYYALALWSTRSYLRRRVPAPTFTPPVSVLKPLSGADPNMYENFRSHCVQDYPNYEIVFGVSDPNDAAIPVVKRIQADFPHIPIRLCYCEQRLGTNIKVSNLIRMQSQARHEYLVINDSDMHVPPDYLRKIAAPFQDEKVGMVTCVYRGREGGTLGSKLEAMGINTHFMAGVLVARVTEGGVHFALGSTLAFPRRSLALIGGLETLVDYLADDFELGARISGAGREVILADTVVETQVHDYTMGDYVDHQLRWNRSTRYSRPAGYAGIGFTFGLFWAMIACAFSGGAAWGWGLLSAALAMRAAQAAYVGRRVVRDSNISRKLWLLPALEVAAVMLWAGAFFGRAIRWRGRSFVLVDGKMRPLTEVDGSSE